MVLDSWNTWLPRGSRWINIPLCIFQLHRFVDIPLASALLPGVSAEREILEAIQWHSDTVL